METDNGQIVCDNRTLPPNLCNQPGETIAQALQQSAWNSQDLANSQISAPASSCNQPEKAKYAPPTNHVRCPPPHTNNRPSGHTCSLPCSYYETFLFPTLRPAFESQVS